MRIAVSKVLRPSYLVLDPQRQQGKDQLVSREGPLVKSEHVEVGNVPGGNELYSKRFRSMSMHLDLKGKRASKLLIYKNGQEGDCVTRGDFVKHSYLSYSSSFKSHLLPANPTTLL